MLGEDLRNLRRGYRLCSLSVTHFNCKGVDGGIENVLSEVKERNNYAKFHVFNRNEISFETLVISHNKVVFFITELYKWYIALSFKYDH